MHRGLGGLLVVCLATAGCATTAYEPVQSPRVSVVSNAYVRDGRKFEAGFASGLEEAVQGNARAESVASSAHGLMIGGFVVTIAGAAAVGAGAGVWAAGIEKDSAGNVHSKLSNVALGLALGGFAVELIGSALWNSGRAHELDAINIYNDGLSLRPAQPASPLPRALAPSAPSATVPPVPAVTQ